MEHNEYSLWKVRVRFSQQIRQQVSHDESNLVGHKLTERELNIVAPQGQDGQALLQIHIRRSFGHLHEPLPGTDQCYEIVEAIEVRKIDAFVRYEDAYRARF
jgi:hypothetical protein